ncbi:atherin-like [Ailuropoda melanoleuca]|uniref:atherin-like n=1 Tax=Ailuropoda melanoleuca TaxID=9646 RepID=UPI001493FE34|nr:atherin-like [Ailuropoda melanoleuca]
MKALVQGSTSVQNQGCLTLKSKFFNPTLYRFFPSSGEACAGRGEPEESAEPRASRVGADAAAAEAVAAPPPPARPNRRYDGHARAARPPPVGAPATAGRPQAGAGWPARSCRRLPGTISAVPRVAAPPGPLARAHRGGRGLRRDPPRPRPVGWRRRGKDPSLPGLYRSCPAAREDLPARSGGVRGGGAEGTSRGPPSSEKL